MLFLVAQAFEEGLTVPAGSLNLLPRLLGSTHNPPSRPRVDSPGAKQCFRELGKKFKKNLKNQSRAEFSAEANPCISPVINRAMLIYTSCRCDLGHNSLLHLPCWVMLGGFLLKSHCSGPLAELGPTCLPGTVHFTLPSSVC